jgi:Ca-activated chloride channel family protein
VAQSTLDYVSALEKTVRHYGEGEWALIQQMLQSGPSYLDAVVVQEQLVVHFNSQGKGRLVAIYPAEGSLWEDHPLALLEQPGLTIEQRQAFAALRDYLLSADAQRRILQAGYRPVDLGISLTDAASPIKLENGVDPLQPKTVLQIPGAGVLQVVRDVWWYTKRHTNVYLVADTSGSMDGAKLADAKEALATFLDQIKGDVERVGLIRFASGVNEVVPLGELKTNREQLARGIDGLEAGGNTALLDAVRLAYGRLQALDDSERINAIVVMTDGQENASQVTLSSLGREIELGNKQGLPVVVFCIAYGSDADMQTLQYIADAAGGQARKGDLETIRQLYKTLSAYF